MLRPLRTCEFPERPPEEFGRARFRDQIFCQRSQHQTRKVLRFLRGAGMPAPPGASLASGRAGRDWWLRTASQPELGILSLLIEGFGRKLRLCP